jgi:hypothetical protein
VIDTGWWLVPPATHTRTNFSTTSSTKSVSRFLRVDSSKEQKFFSLDRGDKSLA